MKDNAFTSVSDPDALNQAAKEIDGKLIQQRIDYWMNLFFKFDKGKYATRSKHLKHDWYLTQVEVCSNVIFKSARFCTSLFERLLDKFARVGLPDTIAKIFSLRPARTDSKSFWRLHSVFLYGKYREVNAYSQIIMLKTLKNPVRVVWVFRKTQWLAIFSTDLELSVEQIIEYYGARWKIESGFKEIKQDIGSSKSQTRNAQAVINHINFSIMAATIVWIYGSRLENIPERRHKVKGCNSFAFSDLRHIIAKCALSDNFHAVCNQDQKLPRKSFLESLLRMAC